MKTLLIVLLLAASVQAQSFKFYWHDRWNSHEPGLFYYDKLDHLAANAFGVWALKKVGMESIKTRFYVVTGLSVAYEIRDGFRHKHTGGFSFHDLVAGMAGQGLVFAGEKLFSKPKSQKYDEALRQELEALRARVEELEKHKIVITPSPMPSILHYSDDPHFQPVPLRRVDIPYVIFDIDSLGATFSVDSSFTIIGESKIK